MSSSFQNKKSLRFLITLGSATFGDSNNQIILEGFRASIDIDKAGGMMMGTLRAAIYGVRQSEMNSITTLQWKPGSLIPNTIQVYAIDGTQPNLIFQGNIVNAWGNYNNMPDVFLQIQAQSAYFYQLNPVVPRSFPTVDVSDAMNQIANDMQLAFEGNGVSVSLADVYLPNTNLEQAKSLARMAGVDLYVDDTILAITNPHSPRNAVTIPEISPNSGLVGYPTFDGVGVNFQTQFNPAILFGGTIKLVTALKQAAGPWIVTSISHRLESEKPNGSWFSTVRGNTIGLAIAK